MSGPGLPARLVTVDGQRWFPSAVFWTGRGGAGTVRTFDVRDGLHVLGDRGLRVPVDPFVGYHQRNCPTPADELTAGESTRGCLVFGLAKDASVGRVVYQPTTERDDPSRWLSWRG